MFIEIISPEATLFSGEIKKAKFPGKEGSFEVLNNHAPLIAVLKKGKIKLTDAENKPIYFEVKGGVVELKKNKIFVLAE
ncbi:MAG TPA: F0F1 ATP synthase subunit epsilon [Bacteroidales bacterium]|nr:F0F1 ATP synthase subunit epsilon [Bacteroidales bacterium]HNZ43968.1 F0F1 ATP synthase subunit epsilon [Bacteroidales bacterium]HPB26578.1 F0F1 ATP synthase subunit epsilon [Bacteroidales bacterium]HQN17402.1 F0F1 ATP synthase subunit epsilon [Bacteroidales bacterium]HQP16883.1 F0F1 ATP synthase subunit epsilon [Bacteroidales bacterium]